MKPKMTAASTPGPSQYRLPAAWASRVAPLIARQPQLAMAGKIQPTTHVSSVS
jgi:hypothetical protein